jgi:hypothetical protein
MRGELSYIYQTTFANYIASVVIGLCDLKKCNTNYEFIHTSEKYREISLRNSYSISIARREDGYALSSVFIIN